MSAETPASPAPSVRYHGFDALRASMMLLGIVMHVGLTYSSMPANPIWPVKDSSRTAIADFLFSASGLFRMPAFFLMAGFFAGLLVDKRSEVGFLKNRIWRLAPPFAIGWLAGFPVLRAAFIAAGSDESPLEAVVAAARDGSLFASPYPIHLWFLEYLLILSAAGVALAPLALPLAPLFRSGMRWGWLPLAGAAAAAVPVASTPMGALGSPLSFVPDAAQLVGYFLFFAAGWGLFGNRDLLPNLARWGWPTLALGVVIAAATSTGIGPPGPPAGFPAPPPGFSMGQLPPFPMQGGKPPGLDLPSGAPPFPFPQGFDPAKMKGAMPFPPAFGGMTSGLGSRLPRSIISSTVAWLLAWGLAGVFLMHFNRPFQAIQYFSSASYWLYLAHFPVAAWIGLLLRSAPLPGAAKLLLCTLLVVLVLVAPFEAMRRLRRLPRRSPIPTGGLPEPVLIGGLQSTTMQWSPGESAKR